NTRPVRSEPLVAHDCPDAELVQGTQTRLRLASATGGRGTAAPVCAQHSRRLRLSTGAEYRVSGYLPAWFRLPASVPCPAPLFDAVVDLAHRIFGDDRCAHRLPRLDCPIVRLTLLRRRNGRQRRK